MRRGRMGWFKELGCWSHVRHCVVLGSWESLPSHWALVSPSRGAELALTLCDLCDPVLKGSALDKKQRAWATEKHTSPLPLPSSPCCGFWLLSALPTSSCCCLGPRVKEGGTSGGAHAGVCEASN